MAVPKRKTSRTTTKLRRTHKKIGSILLVDCSNCGEKILSHRVCSKCGHFHGRKVIENEE